MILDRRQPRHDPDDERILGHAELVEHPSSVFRRDRIERLRVEEVGDRHDAGRRNPSLRLHEPRDTGAVADDAVGEAVRDAVRAQDPRLAITPRTPAIRAHIVPYTLVYASWLCTISVFSARKSWIRRMAWRIDWIPRRLVIGKVCTGIPASL